MSIGLQAYLQGYMHEKSGADTGRGRTQLISRRDPNHGVATNTVPNTTFGEIWGGKGYNQAERAKGIPSPITHEDLYRRYGRVPDGSLYSRVYPFQKGVQDEWEIKENDKITRDVTDRITAANRAATTGKLQASGKNKGRGGLAGLLRGAVEKSYNVVKAVGTEPRRKLKTLGWTPKLNTQRGYAGAEQDAALSQKIEERYGEPLSQGKR